MTVHQSKTEPAKFAEIRYKRIVLRPLEEFDNVAWRRIHSHFRDPELSYLNGTPPSRLPLWLLRKILKADSKLADRHTFGIFAQVAPSKTAPYQIESFENKTMKKKANVKEAGQVENIALASLLSVPFWQKIKNDYKTDNYKADNANIRDNQTNQTRIDHYIGTTELYDVGKRSATIGILIGERAYWGQGYGPEAMHALLSYAFEDLQLEDVRLHTFADNLRAQASFKKVGFTEMRRVPVENERVDVQMFILADVWRRKYQKHAAIDVN